MPAPLRYSRAQVRLHWLVAALIALQFLLHDAISDAWDAFKDGADVAFDPLVAQHVFTGLLVAALVLWRLALRVSRGVPDLPEEEPRLMKIAAHVAHWALYALMLLLPVSGAFAWFAGAEQAAAAHNVLKVALLALVALHVAAVLVHQFVLRTGLISRMGRA
jgi:cytochrome b561